MKQTLVICNYEHAGEPTMSYNQSRAVCIHGQYEFPYCVFGLPWIQLHIKRDRLLVFRRLVTPAVIIEQVDTDPILSLWPTACPAE